MGVALFPLDVNNLPKVFTLLFPRAVSLKLGNHSFEPCRSLEG